MSKNISAMLYLAQVKKKSPSNTLALQLIAQQESETFWISCQRILPIPENELLNEGLLLLVKLGENDEILEIKNAKDWVLKLVEKYLSNTTINQEFLDKEKNDIEQWRKELTSQSQDLTKMRLEIESRREQLQELEATLNAESELAKEN